MGTAGYFDDDSDQDAAPAPKHTATATTAAATVAVTASTAAATDVTGAHGALADADAGPLADATIAGAAAGRQGPAPPAQPRPRSANEVGLTDKANSLISALWGMAGDRERDGSNNGGRNKEGDRDGDRAGDRDGDREAGLGADASLEAIDPDDSMLLRQVHQAIALPPTQPHILTHALPHNSLKHPRTHKHIRISTHTH